MAIQFNEIKFRNFLSYSNTFTTYTFKKGITKIGGLNGHGKSVLVDAVYYALFGKPFRKITLPIMVNSINRKHLEVKMMLSVDNNDYVIRRGIKPNIFEIYKNDELIDQNSTKKGYQEYLEEDILKFNEDIFQQIGVKSLTRMDSFLTLPKQKKRQIIENIFGIEILSEMKDVNKLKMDGIETDIQSSENSLYHFEDLIKQEQKNIEKLKEIKRQLEEDLDAKNQRKESEIEELEADIVMLETAMYKINNSISSVINLEKEKAEYYDSIHIIEIKTKGYDRTIAAFDDRMAWVESKCPTCPNLAIMKQDNDIGNIKDQKRADEGKIILLNKKIDKLRPEINRHGDVADKKALVANKIEFKKNEIGRIKISIEIKPKTSVEIDETNLKIYDKGMMLVNKKIKQFKDSLVYRRVIDNLLQDSGIKSYIIKKYLPILNKLMNTYLQKFDIDLEIQFSSDLEMGVMTKFKEKFQYDSFSEGQKKRINLALVFTFLEFCKLKYSNSSINILILDEFAGGLDDDGEYNLFRVLKDIVETENKEVISISPKDDMSSEIVDRNFIVKIERGFSHMELVEEN